MSDPTWLIEAKISEIWKSFVEAINERDFNENSLVWKNLSHDFIHETDAPGPERSGFRARDNGPFEHLETLRELTRRCPHYKQYIKNTCIAVDPKLAFAEAVFDIDVYGLFKDVIRPHVTHAVFQFREGRWVCTLAEVVSGQAIADGTTGELIWPERKRHE